MHAGGKRFLVARGDSARNLVTGPLGRSGPQVLCRGVGNDLLRPQSLGGGCPLHWVDGPAFTGGAGYISSASYARRGQLVTTDGELRRPTSSRCTDGDATAAPIPRVPKSPSRLAASRPIRTCRTPGERREERRRRSDMPGSQAVRVVFRSRPWPGTARAATPRARSVSRARPEPDRKGVVYGPL